MTERPEWVLTRWALGQHHDERSREIADPHDAGIGVAAIVYNLHARVLLVERNRDVDVTHDQRDVREPDVTIHPSDDRRALMNDRPDQRQELHP